MRTSRLVNERGQGGTMVSQAIQSRQPVVSEMEFYGPRRVPDGVLFSALFPQAKSVQLAGDFNNWQPAKTPMQKTGDGIWQVRLSLSKGTYRYRFVVDGNWQQDPNNKLTDPNPYGGLNSVIKVV
jgi:1,4-alpha-glucan branching enzyme